MNLPLKTKALAPDARITPEALLKALETRDEDLINKLAALQTEVKSLPVMKEQLAQVEQRLVEGGGFPSGEKRVSVGASFIADERIKAFAMANPTSGKIDLQLKASLTSLTTDAAGSVGAGIFSTRDPNIDTLPRRRPIVRDLLPVIPMTGGSVEVIVQKGRTNGAGMVAEGAAKPSSDIQLELKTFNARVIAHWTKASRQVMDDIPQIAGIIDTELLDGLALKEEDQILSGDGTGQNLYGLIPQASAYSAPIVISDINKIDVIGLAMLQVSRAYFAPDGVVMNDGDWLEIRLLKDSQGNYIYGPPGAEVTPRLFGLPVVPTTAIAQGTFLVGSFKSAATIYDRWAARVQLGYENDDFTKNMVTILGEERLALAVRRPIAMVTGTFDAALAA